MIPAGPGTALLLLALAAGSGKAPRARPPARDGGRDLVLLLHGLGRSPRSMHKLAASLESRGFETVVIGYPSRKASIEDNAGYLAKRIAACCSDPSRRVHFVTHSLGGILLRVYFSTHSLPNLGRVVMIGPPNQGSEVADLLPKVPFAARLAGPSAVELGTGKMSGPADLGPVSFDLGIIAGNRSYNPVFSLLIPGADDGMVGVDRTKVSGMTDFLILPHTHTFIIRSPEVARQAAYFLEHGRFDRREAPARK